MLIRDLSKTTLFCLTVINMVQLNMMKIIKKDPKYVYNLNELDSNSDYEVFGREAVLQSYLKAAHIKSSPALVIGSTAFDDFLLFNDLAGQIARILQTVRPFIQESAREASEQITNLILSASVQPALLRQFEEAYSSFISKQEKPSFNILYSDIIPIKYLDRKAFPKLIIDSKEKFSTTIKLIWNSLFDLRNIELRVNSYYTGDITMAAIAQIVQKAEISGTIEFLDKSSVQASAYYGIKKPDSDVDQYTYDLEKQLVTQIKIVPQRAMYVNTGVDQNSIQRISQVEVSQKWQSVAKLSEDKLQSLFKDFQEIYRLIKHPIRLGWNMVMGEIYAFSIELQENVQPRLKTEPVEVMPEREAQREVVVDEKEPAQIDIDAIAREVQEVIAGNISLEETELEEQQLSDPLSKQFSDTQDYQFRDRFSEQNYFKKLNLLFSTELYLELSRPTSARVSALSAFHGSFVDGTEVVLNQNQLPERLMQKTIEKTLLIDKYAQNIAAASKGVSRLLYSLSNITNTELNLLGEVAEPDQAYGDERLINSPLAIDIELSALKRAKNIYDARNISICIPSVRNISNLKEIKKIINGAGFRRNASFEILFELSLPAMTMQLEFLEANEVDGCIINLNSLYSYLHNRSRFDSQDQLRFTELLTECIVKLKAREQKIFFLMYEVQKEYVNLALSQDIDGIIFSNIPSEEMLRFIWENEKKD